MERREFKAEPRGNIDKLYPLQVMVRMRKGSGKTEEKKNPRENKQRGEGLSRGNRTPLEKGNGNLIQRQRILFSEKDLQKGKKRKGTANIEGVETRS